MEKIEDQEIFPRKVIVSTPKIPKVIYPEYRRVMLQTFGIGSILLTIFICILSLSDLYEPLFYAIPWQFLKNIVGLIYCLIFMGTGLGGCALLAMGIVIWTDGPDPDDI